MSHRHWYAITIHIYSWYISQVIFPQGLQIYSVVNTTFRDKRTCIISSQISKSDIKLKY